MKWRHEDGRSISVGSFLEVSSIHTICLDAIVLRVAGQRRLLILSVHAVRPDRNEVKVRIHVQECHCGPICDCKFTHLDLKGQKPWKHEQLISLMLHL